MAKGPLVTRSELRKRKIESPSEQTKEQKQAQRDYQQEEKNKQLLSETSETTINYSENAYG